MTLVKINMINSILSLVSLPWKHRELLWQLTKREVIGRYRGSALGILWSFFNPILMLAVYTFFFSIVYQARWGYENHNHLEFAITLFAGLIPFTLFSECINRAPFLITNNVNYVKKVIFPLEILPWVSLGSALFHALMSMTALLLFFMFANHTLHWTIVFLPLVNLPLILFILGLTWLLASLGVFIRDIAQSISLFTLAFLFLSPVFYSMSAVPEAYRKYIYLNPLTTIIEQNRAILISGELPNWHTLGVSILFGAGVAWLGYGWFRKTKSIFADVV